MDASRTLNNKRNDLKVSKKCTPGPINFLPPEIIREIFFASLDKTIPTHTAPPMIFCHVSSLWRQIAMSTPSLWTRLAINRDATTQNIARIASEWFSLAKGLPLSLRIQNTKRQDSSLLSNSLARPSLIIAPQRSWRRIHSLEIDVVWMSDAVRLLDIFVGRETDLERFVVKYSSWSRSTFTPFQFPPFYKLKKLILSSHYLERIHYGSYFDNIPWNQLTHLSMVDVTITPRTWIFFLRRCTRLQHGFFALDTEELWPNTPGDTIFPSIISLKVAFRYKGEWEILDGLSFPSLQTLCLGTMDAKPLSIWHSTTSSSFDAPLVQNLTLFRVRIQHPDLIILLQSMAGLRALVLDIPMHCSSICDRLSRIDTDVFLPNLVRLSIYHWRWIQNRPNEFDENAFVSMMRARWYSSSTTPRPSRAPLSSVSIRIAKDASQLNKIKLKLHSLIKLGLFLQIGSAREGYPLKKEVDW